MIKKGEPDAMQWTCDNAAYHADHSHVSHSAMEVFRESRETYRALYIDHSMSFPDPTEAMALGTAIHAAILEPDWFRENYCVSPKFDRRTNAGKADAAKWEAEHGGKTCINLLDMQTVNAVREAAMANRVVRTLVEETPPECREHSIKWTCQETGMPCKSRRDLHHRNYTVDFKSLGFPMSAGTVARRMASMGYPRQAAHYQYGERQFSGELKPFVFVFLGVKPPYSVGIFDIDDDDLNHAYRQNQEILAAMARCRRESAEYTPEYANSIYTVTLPKWTRYEDEYGF